MEQINTSDNYTNLMTKSLGHQLHYVHTDYILGNAIGGASAASIFKEIENYME